MSGQSIIINNQPLDLDVNTVIATTKRVANIGKLERQASFTNKLDLPPTANNLEATGLVQGNDDSELKYSRQTGQVISNGINVLANAEIMTEKVGDRISILINAGNSIFFDLVSKLKLRDLDMSELDHVWNMQNEFDSIPHTWEDGYIYGIVNTGNQSITVNNLQCQGVPPQVFAKYLFKKIADNFGYTMEGTWWDEPLFEDLILTITEARTGERIQNDVLIAAEKTVSQGSNTIFNQFFKVTNWQANTFDKWGVWNINSNSAYEIKFPGVYEFTVNYFATVTEATPSISVDAQYRLKCIKIIAGVVTDIASQINYITSLGTNSGTLSILVDLNDELFTRQNSNVFVSFEIGQRQALPFDPIDPYEYDTRNVVDLAYFLVERVNAPTTHYNRPINIQESLPDWTCGKLINEVCNIGGVIPLVNEFEKKIRLFMLNDIDTNKANPYEWQDKLDLSIKPEYTFKVEGYARTMNFYYNQDSLYGFTLNVDNEQLAERIDYIKSAFNYMTTSIILGKSFVTAKIPLWDASKLQLKFNKQPYLGLIQRKVTGVTYTSYFEPNIVMPLTAVPFVYFSNQLGVPYNLDWQFLYREYYERIMSGIINNMLQVDADFRLDEFDVNDVDFSIPVYLTNPSGLYFLQSINDFTTSQDSSRLQLIRIV